MLDKPVITQSPTQPAAVIRFTIPRDQIRMVMGPGIGELMATIRQQGLAPAGPIFSHHLKMSPQSFDFELGVPVARPIAAAGRVQPGQLPAAKVARTIYRGPYEGLGDAWGEFMGWIAAEGLSAAPDLWECYLAGPESGPDASKWQTQLNRPLIH